MKQAPLKMISFWALITFLCTVYFAGCEKDHSIKSGGSGDVDGDGDGDGDGDDDNKPEGFPNHGHSHLWVANTQDSTLSKINTVTKEEVARYRTCPAADQDPPSSGDQSRCDPSRTSVNMHGDVVVTNRTPMTGPSSVTKFAANLSECIDRNKNGVIDSSKSPEDILPWGEDECMLWHTELQNGDGARATAWDGKTDLKTGKGGNVLIGTCIKKDTLVNNNVVYVIDGDTGNLSDTINLNFQTECAYGGAMDSSGNLWIMQGFGFPNTLIRINIETKAVRNYPNAPMCGYGISVDKSGKIWTSGKKNADYPDDNPINCISRFDPVTETEVVTDIPATEWLRGLAVGSRNSAGYVWVADTSGKLYQVDEETVTVTDNFKVGGAPMVGVAIDRDDGFIWTVSQGDNATYKVNPDDHAIDTVMVGESPYTYSDMTGAQLETVVIVQ